MSDISNVFANKYKEPYNCVSYDQDEMNEVCESLVADIKSQCNTNLCQVPHVIDSTRTIGKLKPNKADGVHKLMSDSLIQSGSTLHTHLSLLYTSMLRHGVSPKGMCLSTIIPIPKNRKKCLNESNNYRGIALGSLLGKILDNIIMYNNSHVLRSSDLQFGFKSKHSTTQCTFVLNEIVDYYARHDSPVYVTLLDASQAFDRVQYVKMFKLLIKRGICS